MTTHRYAVGDRVKDRGFHARGRGTVTKLQEPPAGSPWGNYYDVRWDKIPTEPEWMVAEERLRTVCPAGIGAVVAMVAAAAWLERRKTVSSKTSLRFDVQTSGIGWDSWQRCEDESSAVALRDHYVVRELTDERTHVPWKWRAVATRTAIEVLP